MSDDSTPPDDDGGIGLADMIIALRSELLLAQQDPASADLPLETGQVELDLSVAVTKTAEGRAGIKFWILDAGGGGSRSGTTTQSFKIVLQPKDPVTGGNYVVSDTRAQGASRG